MTDYPERINISPVHRQKRENDFYLVDRAAFPGKGVEYIRADVAEAMVAAAYDVAAYECAGSNLGLTAEDVADDIRAHTPTDARAALEAMVAKTREDALREAAKIAKRYDKASGCMDCTDTANILRGILALIDRTAEDA